MAGVAAARNNSIGLVGISPGVTLWSIKVGNYVPDPEEVYCGTEYARHNGAHVVNMSMSLPYGVALFESIRRGYYFSGITFVASAGNNHGDPASFPANMYEVIAANAVNSSNQRDPINSAVDQEIELVAPGTDVPVLSAGGGTGITSGTSYAAPHVAAAAAILRAKYPSIYINGDVIRRRLNDTATPIGHAWEYGNGLLNIEKALKPGVTVSGPTRITSPGTYEWTANPSGGNGSFTYRWSVYWHNTGYTAQLGTAKKQSLYIDGSDGNFTMKVTVTSAGVPGYAPGTRFVLNSACGGTFC